MVTPQKTFDRARLGPLALANHIVMAPMTRSRAPGGIPNAMMATYYAQRASAGLIVTEGTAPSADGSGYARIPGLYTEEHAVGWKLVTDAVHQKGGRIFVQLMHTGRIFHPLNLPAGATGVAPSAIPAAGNMWTDQFQLQPNGMPRALGDDAIALVRDQIVASAQLAMQAGFDGVELHGANGYLLEQFLNPASNVRTDAYGGSVENRTRFVVEVTRAVADAIGPERTAIRLSPWSTGGDLPHFPEIDETFTRLAAELQAISLVYLHIFDPSRHGQAGVQTLARMRRHFANTLILNGGFRTVQAIDEALAAGRADLVSIGAPFISNPDLPARLRAGQPLAVPVPATFYAPGPTGLAEGYIDYPVAA